VNKKSGTSMVYLLFPLIYCTKVGNRVGILYYDMLKYLVILLFKYSIIKIIAGEGFESSTFGL
jgi:hypothetical protein